MKKTIVSLLIMTLLPVLSGAPTVRNSEEPKDVRASVAPGKAIGQAETVRGNLMMVVEEQRLIVLKGQGGVPYNFRVTPATKIHVGSKTASFKDLAALTNATLSVTFVPMQNGNFARNIQVEP